MLRHFQPLFELELVVILGSPYPDGITIAINDRVVIGPIRPAER